MSPWDSRILFIFGALLRLVILCPRSRRRGVCMLNRTKTSPTKLTPPAWGLSKNPKTVESQIELRFSTKPQKFKPCPQISPHQFLVPTTRRHPPIPFPAAPPSHPTSFFGFKRPQSPQKAPGGSKHPLPSPLSPEARCWCRPQNLPRKSRLTCQPRGGRRWSSPLPTYPNIRPARAACRARKRPQA